MLKKVICLVLSTILLVGCTSNSENKNYDNEFLTSLSKGLDKRWKDNQLKTINYGLTMNWTKLEIIVIKNSRIIN